MLSLVLSLLLWSIDLNMYGNLRNTSSGSRRIRRLTNVILGRFRCDIYRFACAFREIQANVWMIKRISYVVIRVKDSEEKDRLARLTHPYKADEYRLYKKM